jgi:hypothetical protein
MAPNESLDDPTVGLSLKSARIGTVPVKRSAYRGYRHVEIKGLNEQGIVKSIMYDNETEAMEDVARAFGMNRKALTKVIGSIDPEEGQWVVIPNTRQILYRWHRHYRYCITGTDGIPTLYPTQKEVAVALKSSQTNISRLLNTSIIFLGETSMGDATVKTITCSSERVMCLPEPESTVQCDGMTEG